MARFIYVTSRERRDLYESLTAGFSGQEDIRVIVDRRRGERRAATAGGDAERRRSLDRRRHRDLDRELPAVGSFVTDAEEILWR
jgi:hypothetical protein